jgi:hypothetical protein
VDNWTDNNDEEPRTEGSSARAPKDENARSSPRGIRAAITDLVAGYEEFSETAETLASVIAAHFGTERDLRFLVGTHLAPYGIGLMAQGKVSAAITPVLLRQGHQLAGELWTADIASQVVRVAAERTDIRLIQQFEQNLAAETRSEVEWRARSSWEYFALAGRLAGCSVPETRLNYRFLHLPDLQRVALLALRPADSDDLAEMLTAAEIARIFSCESTSVVQARSKARKSLGI